MTFAFAKQLHNEDEVTVKETKTILTVIKTEIREKAVLVLCDDGNWYHHHDLK